MRFKKKMRGFLAPGFLFFFTALKAEFTIKDVNKGPNSLTWSDKNLLNSPDYTYFNYDLKYFEKSFMPKKSSSQYQNSDANINEDKLISEGWTKMTAEPAVVSATGKTKVLFRIFHIPEKYSWY